MNEIERQVDMLISGIVLPQKRTRRRVATIVASVLIAMTLIVSASLMTYYYEQTATDLDIKSAITITPPGGTPHETPWQEDVILLGTIQAGGEYYTYPEEGHYTITSHANTPITVYIYVDVTEGGNVITSNELTVEVIDISTGDPFMSDQIILGNSGLPLFADFEIHVTADKLIDASSTYGYIIYMECKQRT